MVTPDKAGLVRVTVTLRADDVELIDRLARLEGSNRSAILRSMLDEVRDVLGQTVTAFEGAVAARERLDRAAADATVSELEQVREEMEQLQLRALGAIAKLEGAAAANPRASNHGGQVPTPTPEDEDS